MAQPTSKFEHNGRNYEVRALNIFESGSTLALVMRVLNLLGHQSLDDADVLTQNFAVYFVQWHLASKIDGEIVDIWQPTLDQFNAFCDELKQDTELASKWLQAYQDANLSDTDPNA